MGELVGLVGFSIVCTVTPGPNNVLLWASGATFGFLRTIPHVLGTAFGVGFLAIAVALGIGALIETVPGLAVAMRLLGSVYLLYLAYRIATAGALREGSAAHPLTVLQAAAFQVSNPKVWIFALSAITTFRPQELPVAVGSLVVIATMMVVAIPTSAVWAAAGGTLARFIADDRRRVIVSWLLGGLVALTVVSVWV